VLWEEVSVDVRLGSGVLILDDSVLDKPYARKMKLVHRVWSGKHHRVVKGIDLITLLWTDGDRNLPCDYRIYDRPNDGKTKNDHFADMLQVAKKRGFNPECVLFDGWYSSLENLKLIRQHGWNWLTRLKENRHVNPDRTGLRAVSKCDIAATGTVVHLEGYGLIKVFRIEVKDGTTAYWATNNLQMDELERLRLADASWRIEEYHRGLKQTTNIERCQCCKEVAQRNHIGLALRAFLLVERWCFRTGVNWLSAKWQIVRDAVRAYRERPQDRVMRHTA
jgi:putative transposase